MEVSSTSVLSAILASAVPLALILGYCNRKQRGRSIGWQFIRYTVLAIALPIIGVLALNGSLSGEAAALIGGAMGYAFGKDEREAESKRSRKAQSQDDDAPG